MLVIRARKGDKIVIGGGDSPEITLNVITQPDKSLTLGIDAPREVPVDYQSVKKGGKMCERPPDRCRLSKPD